MKRNLLIIAFISIYNVCFSQSVGSIENLRFEDGHVKFNFNALTNPLKDEDLIVHIKAFDKNNRIVFEIPWRLIEGNNTIDKPYSDLLPDRNWVFNTIYENNNITRFTIANKSEKIKRDIDEPKDIKKFREGIANYVYNQLLKDPKYKHIIEGCAFKINTTIESPFKAFEQFTQLKYKNYRDSEIEKHTRNLKGIEQDLSDYVHDNLFSTTNKKDLEISREAMTDTLRQFKEALRPTVLTCDYENFCVQIDKFEKEVDNYYEICDFLLTPQNSLTIEPLLRKINNKIAEKEKENPEVDKLLSICKARENELINSFSQNKISYKQYQQELSKLYDKIEKYTQHLNTDAEVESARTKIKENLFPTPYNYQYALSNIDNLRNSGYRNENKMNFDEKLSNLTDETREDFTTSIYLGSLKVKTFLNTTDNVFGGDPYFEKYLKKIISYNFDKKSDLKNFNHYIDSLNLSITNDGSSFANDISLMVKRSNPENETIRNEIDTLLYKICFGKCDKEIDKKFVSNTKYSADSILFLWMANIIDNPNDYNQCLKSIKIAVEKYKRNYERVTDIPNTSAKEPLLANLFGSIHNELSILHNKIETDSICLQKEYEIRKDIYSVNSQQVNKIMRNETDSIAIYVEFLINSLRKLGIVNRCISNNDCDKCINDYLHPQEDITVGLISQKGGFVRKIDEFKNSINDYFKVDTTYLSDTILNKQSQEYITNLLEKHPYVFDNYYKDYMKQDSQLVYIQDFFDNHPDKRLEFCPDLDSTANKDNKTQTAYSESNTKNNSKKHTSKDATFDREPSNSNKEYTKIDEKELATSLSEKIAPKLNFLNLDTYIGCGIYQLQSDSSEGWLQPICLEFETTLSNNLESPYQPFLRTSFNLYSTRGASGEFSYGVRFISSKKNYIAFSPFLEGGYFNVTDTKRKPDSILIKNFYEGEAGVCVDLNKNIDEKIFGSKITLHRLNLKLKASHSISDFNRTYVASENADEFKSTYWGLSLESSANVGFMKIKGGYKLYRQDYGLSQYLEKERLYNNRWFIQFLININYLRHNL